MNSRDIVKNSSLMEQIYDLWILLTQTRDAIHQIRRKELSLYSVPIRQAYVLYIIKLIGNSATPAEISRYLFREPHSVSEILTRMETDGLLRKVKDLDKKNLTRIVLTDEGQRIYEQTKQRRRLNRVFSALSSEQKQQLYQLLWKTRDQALKELGAKKRPPLPCKQGFNS